MRSGDPINAKSSKTWTMAHKPFNSPVQRTLPGQAHNAPKYVAQAKGGHVNAELDGFAKVSGDFAAGLYGPVSAPRWKP